MSIKSSFITKNAQAIEYIAKYFILQDVGSRIFTISQFEENINVARGTIQNSIKMLTSIGAVKIKSHGHLGSYLVHKDSKLLLQFAGINFIVGVMPLPYSRIYEGLSTAILFTMENESNIPVNMAYMRGAQRRIQMVLNQRYDFAVISKFAADNYLNDNHDIEIIKEFKPGSYLSKHVLMLSDPNCSEIQDGMKVGIDYDSIDQSLLTKEACKGKNVEFIHVSYTQLLEKIISKEIDATVWNGDEIDTKLIEFHTIPLVLEADDNTRAVVIVDSKRSELKKILNDLINEKEVERIQKLVIDGTIIPSY